MDNDNDNVTLSVIRLWAAAAWADGKVVPKERAVLERFIGNLSLSDEARELALGYLDRKVELKEGDTLTLTAAEREGIYRAACKLTAIDKDVAGSERSFLERLRELLELDQAASQTIERAAGL